MKTSLYIILFLSFFYANSLGQITIQEDSAVYVETMAEFPGGEAAMFKYLKRHIKYPQEAYNNGIEGKVIVEFVVDSNGRLKHVMLLKNVGFGCGEEVIRVIKGMPRWKPATQNGKKVHSIYRIPIKFRIYPKG